MPSATCSKTTPTDTAAWYAGRTGSALFVPVSVLLELEWVLRSSFAFGKGDVLMILSKLLSAAELSFEFERALKVALHARL